MIERRPDRPLAITLGADKGYDAADFVNELRTLKVRPHVAHNTTRRFGRSAINGRTTRHTYVASKRIEEDDRRPVSADATLHRPRRMGFHFYNLVRLPKFLAA